MASIVHATDSIVKTHIDAMLLTLLSLFMLIPIAFGLAAPRFPQSPIHGGLAEAASRRAFFIAASSASFVACQQASAYEFVDVGGGEGSAETKAMNIQAYETNNRLEKGGFRLDTPAAQQQTLTEALSGYSYEPKPNKTTRSTSSTKTSSQNRSPTKQAQR